MNGSDNRRGKDIWANMRDSYSVRFGFCNTSCNLKPIPRVVKQTDGQSSRLKESGLRSGPGLFAPRGMLSLAGQASHGVMSEIPPKAGADDNIRPGAKLG